MKRLAKKSFLNLDGFEGLGAIGVNVGVPDWTDKEIYDGWIDISDCSRKITLALEFETEGQKQNSLYKIKTMIDLLSETYKFCEGIKIIKEDEKVV